MSNPLQTPGWFDFKRNPGESQTAYETRMRETNPFAVRKTSPNPPGAFDSRELNGKPMLQTFPRTQGPHKSKAR